MGWVNIKQPFACQSVCQFVRLLVILSCQWWSFCGLFCPSFEYNRVLCQKSMWHHFQDGSNLCISSWWFQPISKVLVKLDHFPNFRGENKKIFEIWNHQLHPGRLTWNIQITHLENLERKTIWTKPLWGHVPAVHLPGCRFLCQNCGWASKLQVLLLPRCRCCKSTGTVSCHSLSRTCQRWWESKGT